MEKQKVMILGIDGGQWSLIDRWINELPNIKRLMKEGSYGPMKSSTPALSIPAWYVILSGKNPSRIGSFGFRRKNKNSYDIKVGIKPEYLDSALWNHGLKGNKLAIFNIPGTFPPVKVNGFVVGSSPSPPNKGKLIYTYPEKLSREIDRIVGEPYQLETTKSFMHEDNDTMIKALNREMDHHLKALERMVQDKEWDFFISNYTTPDRICHYMWKYIDEKHPEYEEHPVYSNAIKNIYKKLDASIGRIMKLIPKDTVVFIISDHGFGSCIRLFELNEWLMKEGFLELKKEKKNKAKPIVTKELLYKILKFFRVQDIKDSIPQKWKNKVPSIKAAEFNPKDIDWSKTKAFAPDSNCLYINLKEREEQGIVNKKDYEKVIKEFTKKIKDITDPITGKKIPVDVYTKEELFVKSKYYDEAPDLMIEFDNYNSTLGTAIRGDGKIFKETHLNGNHRRDCVFIAHGKGIKKGNKLKKKPHIQDLVPSVLHIMNKEENTKIDGKAIMEIFDKKGKLSNTKAKKSKKKEKTLDEKELLNMSIRKLRI